MAEVEARTFGLTRATGAGVVCGPPAGGILLDRVNLVRIFIHPVDILFTIIFNYTFKR